MIDACAFGPRHAAAPSMVNRLVQIAGVVLFAAPMHFALDPNGRIGMHFEATRRNVGSIWRGERHTY